MFKLICFDTDLPVSWALLAPSVSPHRDPAGSSNPGLRLYKFDTNTGKVRLATELANDFVLSFLSLLCPIAEEKLCAKYSYLF